MNKSYVAWKSLELEDLQNTTDCNCKIVGVRDDGSEMTFYISLFHLIE